MAVDHYRRIEEVLRERLQPAALAGLFRVKRAKLSRGIDRIDADIFERRLSIELGVASRRALSGEFRFSPYLEMLVSKGRKKAPRVIAKPTIRDKLILSALKDALHAELPLDVPRKLPNQVVRELLNVLEASADAQIVKLDIQAFYDRIPHKKLLGRMRKRVGDGLALSLIEAAITGAIVPDSYRKSEYKDYVLTRGVPQGLPISNFLAHIYLSDFDRGVSALFPSYFRYVDDIIVISPVVSESTVEKALTKKLNGIGLGINKEKTKKFCYEDPFVFLGYEIQGGVARPRRGSVEKFVRSVAALFSNLRKKRFHGRKSESWTDEEAGRVFIEELNEKISGAIFGSKQYGWVFYFNESTDLSAFNKVDNIIKKMARRTEHLTNEMRSSIKKTVRAHYESKYNKTGGYIVNYDLLSSVQLKLDYLVRLKYIERNQAMTSESIERLYFQRINEKLARLEKDVGLIS